MLQKRRRRPSYPSRPGGTHALAAAKGDADATKGLQRVDEVICNDPRETLARPTGRKKPKPNAPCPCGSGKKHKKCCGQTDTN